MELNRKGTTLRQEPPSTYEAPTIVDVPLDLVPELESKWGGKCAVHRELYEQSKNQ